MQRGEATSDSERSEPAPEDEHRERVGNATSEDPVRPVTPGRRADRGSSDAGSTDAPSHRSAGSRPPSAAGPGATGVAADTGDEEMTHRERVADLMEDRLDIPMAILAVIWAALIAYDLITPAAPPSWAVILGNAIWVVFIVEFVTRLVVSGRPARFLRRHWPSIFFLALPALRIFRVLRAVRAFRALPAAQIVGSSYRAIGTARSLLGGRIAFLSAASAVAIFAGAQLLYLVEGEGGDRDGSFGDALWWAANAAISGNQVFEPDTALGRLIAVVLSAYAVVVFASVAASLGAYFIESRAERATAEEEEHSTSSTDQGAKDPR